MPLYVHSEVLQMLGPIFKILSLSLLPTFTVTLTCLTLSLPIPLRLYAVPYWYNPLVLISDIWAHWHSGLSARAPERQKLKIVG